MRVGFSLRDVDSDEDESFVKGLANQYGLPFLASVLKLINMQRKGVSAQMAARDLRYAWFKNWF